MKFATIKKIAFYLFIAGIAALLLLYSAVHTFVNRAVTPGQPVSDDTVYYFAYGSNMPGFYLNNVRNVKTYESFYAKLEDHQVRFDLYGLGTVEPSFANLVEAPGAVAHGVAHKIDRASLKRISKTESSEYTMGTVEVITQDNRKITALTLIGKKHGKPKTPSQRYLDIMMKGAKEYNLPQDYIRQLENMDGAYYPVLSELMGMMIYLVIISKSH